MAAMYRMLQEEADDFVPFIPSIFYFFTERQTVNINE